MEEITVKVRRLAGCEDIPLPSYATDHAAGMDLHAAVRDSMVILPGKRALVPTGICLSLPVGVEAQIRPRSGLALKYGITLMNSPGTIDPDYRGELKVILVNLGDEPFEVHRGDRIAQMVISRVIRVSWHIAESLDKTHREKGGFGHTGI